MSVFDFCGYIESRRQQLALPKSQLAKQAHISRSALYRILSGEVSEPDSNTIIKLASALHVHPCYLVQQLLRNRPLHTGSPLITRHRHDGVAFVADSKTPNNALLPVGSRYTKTWELQNIGQVVWEKRSLVCVDQTASRQTGLKPLQHRVGFDSVLPGEVVEISVAFQVPDFPGTFVSHWKMVDENGHFCFPEHSAIICLVQAFDLQAHTG